MSEKNEKDLHLTLNWTKVVGAVVGLGLAVIIFFAQRLVHQLDSYEQRIEKLNGTMFDIKLQLIEINGKTDGIINDYKEHKADFEKHKDRYER